MSLELFVGNYNIDAEGPPAVEVLARQWLQAHRFASEACLAVSVPEEKRLDAYVLGFQEVKHFSKGEDVLNFPLTNQDAWLEACLLAVNWSENADAEKESDPFVLLKRVVYSSSMLIVMARRSLVEKEVAGERKIVSVEEIAHKLHDGEMTGKKGVCGVEFKLTINGNASSHIAVMTSHFQAYSERLDERLWDARQIVDALEWPSKTKTTLHDLAILVGDLNYRIVLPIDEVKQRIADNDLVPLLKADELYANTVRVVPAPGEAPVVADPVFVGWSEAKVEFKPTYKFVNGTDRWDDSGKQRTPAWCDRVLTHGNCVSRLYSSATALKISDHKPILSLITVPLK